MFPEYKLESDCTNRVLRSNAQISKLGNLWPLYFAVARVDPHEIQQAITQGKIE